MDRRTVILHIAGQKVSVVSSEGEEQLTRLANAVNAKANELNPQGRPASPQSIVLVALALAHDLEKERDRYHHLRRTMREWIGKMIARVEHALAISVPTPPQPSGLAVDAEESEQGFT